MWGPQEGAVVNNTIRRLERALHASERGVICLFIFLWYPASGRWWWDWWNGTKREMRFHNPLSLAQSQRPSLAHYFFPAISFVFYAPLHVRVSASSLRHHPHVLAIVRQAVSSALFTGRNTKWPPSFPLSCPSFKIFLTFLMKWKKRVS